MKDCKVCRPSCLLSFLLALPVVTRVLSSYHGHLAQTMVSISRMYTLLTLNVVLPNTPSSPPPPHIPFLMLLLFFGFLNYRRRLYLLRITKGAEVSVASSEKNFHCSLVDLFVWLWRVSVKSFHRQSAGVGRCVFRIREGKVKEKQTRTCLHPMFIDTYSHRDKGTLHLVTDSPQ